MAFTGNTVCDTYVLASMTGGVDFTSGTYFIALYTNAASLGPATTEYTSEGEASGGDYVPGGQPLVVSVAPTLEGGVAYVSFQDVSWSGAITARGALIYQPGANGAVCVLDFGSDKTSSTAFTVQFPPATATSAILRTKKGA